MSDARQVRDVLHHAVQPLGDAGRAFATPQPDDGHTTIRYDAARAAYLSQPFAAQGATLVLAFDPQAFAYRLHAGDAPQGELALDGLTRAEADAALRALLAEAGCDGAALSAAPYALPDHPLAHGARFSRAPVADGVAAFVARHAAATALLGRTRVGWRGASAVRIWPHHFDCAVLVPLDASGGEHARSVGVGLSPGDEWYAGPYWYATPWPYPPADALPALRGAARWHTDRWVGAVLELDGRAADAPDCAAFVERTLPLLRTLLGG